MQRREFLVLSGVSVLGATTGCIGASGTPEEPEYDNWFENVPHFEGFEDHRAEEEVRVMVGAGKNGFLFDPPAITITPGTTVVWEWTGEGGQHVVAERDGAWQNPEGLVESEEHSWSREFTRSNAGTHLYECWPHRSSGMKGGIFVDATE
jgi:halocyanin-like protein